MDQSSCNISWSAISSTTTGVVVWSLVGRTYPTTEPVDVLSTMAYLPRNLGFNAKQEELPSKYLTRVRVATCYTEWGGNTLMTLLIVLVGGGGG